MVVNGGAIDSSAEAIDLVFVRRPPVVRGRQVELVAILPASGCGFAGTPAGGGACLDSFCWGASRHGESLFERGLSGNFGMAVNVAPRSEWNHEGHDGHEEL